ncbi:MAG: hypothetical protein ACJ8MR_10590 [Povalibacter sp.]
MKCFPPSEVVVAVCALVISTPVLAAEPDSGSPLKPLIDVRGRWENVDQDGFAQTASAATVRARLGFETRPLFKTSVLAEGEFVRAFQDDFNSTVNGKTRFPVVGDPDTEEFNRLQLTNTSLPATNIIVGRQRINEDDQRFIGHSGWRQNEQTYDSARIVNQSINKLTIDVAYIDQVNRVFGKGSPVGRYQGDSIAANFAYKFGLGTLSAFAYRLDFDVLSHAPPAQRNSAINDSSLTEGIRFAGDHMFNTVKLAYVGSFATQEEVGRNPLDYSADYYLAEVTANVKAFIAGAGIEVLEGTGTKGFATPLASLHKFQGWADKFLTTPVNGIEDRYATVGIGSKRMGPLQSVSASLIYHDFDAERGPTHYGSEVDLQLQARWNKFTGLMKYTDYHADDLFTDTGKLWAQLEYVW